MSATVAQLRARTRVTAAARRRRPPATLPPLQPPMGAVTAYTATLLSVVRELNAATVRELAALDVPVRSDAQGDVPELDVTATQAARVRARLQALASRLVTRRPLLAAIASIGDRTADHSGGWLAQAKAALGVDLSDDVDLTAKLEGFRRENVSLITSLVDEHVQRVHRVLVEGAGDRVETIARRIQEATGASESRAALIARDQVLSLNAEVTQSRHKAAGIEEFIWRTSKDERVRKDHKLLDGKRFRYDDPPVVDRRTGATGLPGIWFQCRCTAEPILPGIDTEEAPRPTAPPAEPPAKPKRIRYDKPLPELGADDLEEERRTNKPLANERAASFGEMPIERRLQGVGVGAHHNARVQYPENRVGDAGFDDHVASVAAEAFEGVDVSHVKALGRYTGPAYKSVNGFLRTGEEAAIKRYGAKAVAEAPAIIEGAKAALAVLPKAPADMVLFRGALFRNVEGLNELAAASEFESKAFLSTSRDPKVAVGFGGGEFGDEPSVLYRIKKHANGAVLPRTHSNPAESEVLFPPGARFKIVGRQRVSETQLVLDVEEIHAAH